MSELVSCILATRNRRPFFQQALANYRAQTYPRRELIVVDDGETPVGDLCAGVPRVTYIRLAERTPTGHKLNLGIQAARADILQKIDDDDYYGPEFLSTAIQHLKRARETQTLVAWCCFAVLIVGEANLYFSGHGWKSGGTFCFRRALWAKQPFRGIYASSDSWFIRDNQPHLVRVCAPDQYVVVRHGKNTWVRIEGVDSVEGYFKQRRYPKTIEHLVGARNAAFYRSLMGPPA